MSSFVTRSLTSIVIVITITASVLAGVYSFIALLFVINLLALSEFYKLIAKEPFHPRSKEGTLLSVVLFISVTSVLTNYLDWRILLVNGLAVSAILIRELYKNSSTPFQNSALTFFGVAYITVPILFFEAIAFLPLNEVNYHPEIMLGYFVLLWVNDSGAYAVGSHVGKHKLFERISPKKTWEGSVGGAVLTFVIAYFISSMEKELSLGDWFVMSLIIVVMGTYGDLVKSLLKRSANVKDAGNLLPGHGGFLDRFDSLIGSAPFVFGYLVIFKDSFG